MLLLVRRVRLWDCIRGVLGEYFIYSITHWLGNIGGGGGVIKHWGHLLCGEIIIQDSYCNINTEEMAR